MFGITKAIQVFNPPVKERFDEQMRAKIFFGKSRLLGWIANVVLTDSRNKIVIEDFLHFGDWSDEVKRGLQEDGNSNRIDPLELLSTHAHGFGETSQSVIANEYGDKDCFTVTIQPVDGSPEFKLNTRVTGGNRTSVFMDTGFAAWRIEEKIGIGMCNASAISKINFD
jgi:hypothetical protein